MERLTKQLDILRDEIALLQNQFNLLQTLKEENKRLREENALLREELRDCTNDYASIVDRDFGTRRDPSPSDQNEVIVRARETLSHKH